MPSLFAVNICLIAIGDVNKIPNNYGLLGKSFLLTENAIDEMLRLNSPITTGTAIAQRMTGSSHQTVKRLKLKVTQQLIIRKHKADSLIDSEFD